jgi:hypothetical protein
MSNIIRPRRNNEFIINQAGGAGCYFVLALCFFLTTKVYADQDFYGIYSNMQALEGEFSGFEFIIVPSNEGDFVIFQDAEGGPKNR